MKREEEWKEERKKNIFTSIRGLVWRGRRRGWNFNLLNKLNYTNIINKTVHNNISND